MPALRKAINANTSVLQSLRQLMEQPVLPSSERRGGGPTPHAPFDPHDLMWADSPQGTICFVGISRVGMCGGAAVLCEIALPCCV